MKLQTPAMVLALLLLPSYGYPRTPHCKSLATFSDDVRDTSQESSQGTTEPKMKTILEVETDKISYVDKPIIISGTLEMSAKYLSPYDESQETHYAFSLTERSGSQTRVAYVYMKRGERAETLRNALLGRAGKMVGTFTITILKDMYERSSSLLVAELINYRESTDFFKGTALSLPEPEYPKKARKAHAKGLVVVQVTIDEMGNIISARALSGHPLLQQAAVEAAFKARFSPTTLAGQPVKVTGTINYNFSL